MISVRCLPCCHCLFNGSAGVRRREAQAWLAKPKSGVHILLRCSTACRLDRVELWKALCIGGEFIRAIRESALPCSERINTFRRVLAKCLAVILGKLSECDLNFDVFVSRAK